jgi:hypothetical protein
MKVEHLPEYEMKQGDDVTRKELWIVEERANTWKFICRTIYSLPVKAGSEEQ